MNKRIAWDASNATKEEGKKNKKKRNHKNAFHSAGDGDDDGRPMRIEIGQKTNKRQMIYLIDEKINSIWFDR